jgi:acyl carrier protein
MVTAAEILQLMKDTGIARGKCDGMVPDKSLDEQGLDSYDRMSLLTEVEEHFRIEIANDVASSLKTLNDIVNHLNQRN